MKTQLFIRSAYSLLEGMCDFNKTLARCKEYAYENVALVDRNVLAGAMSFKKACEKYQLKAIYGLQCSIELDDRIFSLCLLAENDNGFRNLMKLSSLIMTGSSRIISIEDLNKCRDDNFLILFSDDMPLTYTMGKGLDIENCLERMKNVFGTYYVALCDHDIAYNKQNDENIRTILDQHNIKTLALSRCYYTDEEDVNEYNVLRCIGEKKLINDANNKLYEGRFLRNQETIHSLYRTEDCLNTDKLADLCDVQLNYQTSLPKYQPKNNVDKNIYLQGLCKEGLKRRLRGRINKEYSDRLDYELKVIMDMNFSDYFLIVYDFILFAKKRGIVVGPGRGSAAGSLVSYCLGITDIDPLKYGLLFERFLNPERISMPDIDTDFPDDRRDEVVEYVKERYGIDHVAHIITYGTLKARQVLRDVGRVLNYSTAELDSVCKLIPAGPNVTLKATYETSSLFRQKIESQKRYRDLYNISLKLEGLPRHESTHAAGIVMSLKPLSEVVPLISIENDIYSTQYTMEHLEELGLIKMDFLGLRNLGIIAEIVEDINKDVDFNINTIPLDDRKTFDLICRVNTLGVFQLESSGMMNLIRRLHPASFEEVALTIALFRPGPMENIPLFLENKAHPEKIKYLHKDLEPILKETYGIIVYQEQIMTIARKMAGFSYAKADLLRRAMSKKKAGELSALEDDFIRGCVNNRYSEDLAKSIYNLILKFANYGFNKSHSIAYGLVAYRLAYLKANYPLYFYKALLNASMGSTVRTYEYLSECRNRQIDLKAISINHSTTEYTISGNSLLLPFGICKDVGGISALKIIEERKKALFSDYISCVFRLTLAGVDKGVIENLIYAGAFDEFKHGRNTMIKALPNVLLYVNAHRNEGLLFNNDDDMPIINEYFDDNLLRAENEKKVLGFYFSINPIMDIKKQNNIDVPSLSSIISIQAYVKGFGQIKRLKTHRTKKGDIMAFVDISDDTADLSLVIMPDLYRRYETEIVKDRFIYFEGNSEKEASVLVKNLRVI